MSEITLYFNPSCSKCRNAKQMLDETKIGYDEIQYLDEPLDGEQLRSLIDILDDDPADLVRKDRNFEVLELNADNYQNVDQIVALLVEHPELMQRPVLVKGGRALICRTTERVEEML